jgi:hypothetical protein
MYKSAYAYKPNTIPNDELAQLLIVSKLSINSFLRIQYRLWVSLELTADIQSKLTQPNLYYPQGAIMFICALGYNYFI